MKKIAVLFPTLAIALFGIVGIGVSTVFAAGSATMNLSPTNVSVDPGETFTLSVVVNPNGASLDTVRLNIRYDSDAIEALSYDNGSLFPFLSPANEIDNDSDGVGELSYGAFKFGSPVTSSGVVGTVTFRALTGGSHTVTVNSTSKLISDGIEKLNTSNLGSTSVSVSGGSADKTQLTDTPTADVTIGGETEEDATDEENALTYFTALAGRTPSTLEDWDMHQCIIDDSCLDVNARDLSYENAALAFFNNVFGTNPSSAMDWNSVHALAYTSVGQGILGLEPLSTEVVETPTATETPAAEEEAAEEEEVVEEEKDYSVMTDVEKEATALKYFGAFYGRMPSSGNDWDALHCMAYGGCQGDPRDVEAEAAALETYGAKYGKMPETTIEWNTLHVLAYTDLLQAGEEEVGEVEEVEEVEEVVEEEVVEGEVVEEESDELTDEDAIGLYGQIYGELPGDGNSGWSFVDIAVNGYTGERDLDAEAAALETYTSTFNSLPASDSDWRVMDAIAYSTTS